MERPRMRIRTVSERIRDHLQEFNQKKWGFVIYRCTYDDDRSWECFIDILGKRVHDYLEEDNGLDLMESLEWTVHSDHATLNGANIDKVRDCFKEWIASDAAKGEQAGTIQPDSPRYTYCIHVDNNSLDSVVNKAPQPPAWDMNGTGYINLVDSMWPYPKGAEYPEDEEIEDLEDDEDDEVGWMRVCVDGLQPAAYANLQNRAM
jgi:hypothetical protein